MFFLGGIVLVKMRIWQAAVLMLLILASATAAAAAAGVPNVTP
jgi:hypothetical protein